MNICFLAGDMSRVGGTERMTTLLANELCNSLDNHVYIISLHMKGDSVFFSLDERIIHVCLHVGKLPSQILSIRRFFIKNNIEVVINVDTGMGLYGIWASTGLHTRIITWEHGNYYNNWNSHLFPYIRRFSARYSDAMVVLTECDKQNYEDHIRHCAPLHVIHNPARTRNFTYDTTSRLLLSAGHLSSVKRFMLIPEIGKRVFKTYPDWQWIICGEGPERERLERYIREARLEENIILIGAVLNMDAQYRRSALYVMTSETEGMPMVLLEAKSYGLPIVSFDIMTGPSEIVRDGVNGYLVESGNVEGIAERILKLIENAELRQSFSEASQFDMDKFDMGKVVEQWQALLEKLMERTL